MAELSEQEIKERLKNLTPEQMQELVKQQCVFCKIVAGEIPAYKIYEDKLHLAFLDINPANPGHVMVIPKKHYSVIPQMPDEEAGLYFIIIKRIIAAVHQAVGALRVQLLRIGELVPHVHIHVIPRFEDDGLETLTKPYEPKKFTEEQFKAIQEKIVKTISKPAEAKPAPKETKPEEKPTLKTKEIKKKKLPTVKSRLP